jgi:hypothetical protein
MFWVSSCWKSRAPMISLNSATVCVFAASIFPVRSGSCAVTRTGWDMDPCVVISFGKKVFRTRVIRHSLNPTWNEKLIFHVRRYESKFRIQFSVLDWDKLSANDRIGDATLDLTELIGKAPQKDPETDLYAENEDGIHDLDDFKVQLVMPKDLGADPKYKPELSFRLELFLVLFFPPLMNKNSQGQVPAVRRTSPKVLASVPQTIRCRRIRRHVPARDHHYARLSGFHPFIPNDQFVLHSFRQRSIRGVHHNLPIGAMLGIRDL